MCVYDGHLSHLKQVDFDLHAHLHAQLMMIGERYLFLPQRDPQRLTGRQPLQYSPKIYFHPFDSGYEYSRESCSHPSHWPVCQLSQCIPLLAVD